MAADRTPAADRDRAGLDRLLAVRPVWTALVPARERIALDGRWLLHAGPPLADPCRPPPPVLASAVLACRYEGWARSDDAAQGLIRQGRVRLSPAQDQRCVTPLAALVSPRTTLVVVDDAARHAPPVYAPLGALGGPDLRFGTRDAAILERLRARDGVVAATLHAALSEPIDLLAIAREALCAGDDLHNRTAAATQALAARLAAHHADAGAEQRLRADDLARGLAATPLFFLTLWMAAARLMLSAAEHGAPRTLITRMAGNGEVFGVSLAGAPERWTTVPGTAPRGPYLNPAWASRPALAAIGDSAVIDALGCGGQALHLAPEPRTALTDFLPAGRGAEASPLTVAAHPRLDVAGLRVGLDAARVIERGTIPIVTLAMVDAAGEQGLLGRGVYAPPIELFADALKGLS